MKKAQNRRNLLDHAFAHHIWATLKLLDACTPLTDEQLDAVLPGTFGSILETWRHLVEADAWYLHRLSEGATPTLDTGDMNLAQLRSVIEEHGGPWAEYLASDPDPDKPTAGKSDDGSVVYWPTSIRVAQVLHHGTDHRSQICTALTSLGIQPPEIDVWDFGWEQGLMVTEPGLSSMT